MWRLVLCVVIVGSQSEPRGAVWPQPQHQMSLDDYNIVRLPRLKIRVNKNYCPLVQNAIRRLKDTMYTLRAIMRKYRNPRPSSRRSEFFELAKERYCRGTLEVLDINLDHPCEQLPYFGMDESYKLTVLEKTAVLDSESVWGILRGLETFAQLVYISEEENELHINVTHILDYPRYKHRGLLLDTSRHYISVNNILTTLDAMAANKMNVFHWHIVDDQSFPYVSENFPKLSENGAYHPSMLYKKEDVKKIIEFARERGIRVVPEFDVPGHTLSWGKAYPDIVISCSNNLGVMNPAVNTTYHLLNHLYEELHEVFPDKFIHIGGDEVNTNCWLSNDEVRQYMQENHITDVKYLQTFFIMNAISLATPSNIIVWQEVFDNNVPLAAGSLIQVWKYEWKKAMSRIIKSGFQVLFSSTWYLDYLEYDFEYMYVNDPTYMVTQYQAQSIAGGEACMWGEKVDDTNVISRVWPRASAVAEVLWSPLEENSKLPKSVAERIDDHTCRMRRRRIDAQPVIGPGFCLV